MSTWVKKFNKEVGQNTVIDFNASSLGDWAFKKAASLVSIAFAKAQYDFDAGQLIKDTDFVVTATYSDSTTEQVQTSCEYYFGGSKIDLKTGWRIGSNGTLTATYGGKSATTELVNWI